MKWGEAPADDMTWLGGKPDAGETWALISSVDEKKAMGADAALVTYTFWQGRFLGVTIFFDNDKAALRAFKKLLELCGTPKEEIKNYQYSWTSATIEITDTLGTGGQNSQVLIVYSPIAAEWRADQARQEEKSRKGKR